MWMVMFLWWQLVFYSQQFKVLCEKYGEWVFLLLYFSYYLCGSGGSVFDIQLYFLVFFWKQVQFVVCIQDYEQMVDLVIMDDMYLFLVFVGCDFCKVLECLVFGCCIWGYQQQGGYYLLQVEWYIWVILFICRYLDVVLQWQILLVLGYGGFVYFVWDIDGFCQGFSFQYVFVQSYQWWVYSLYLVVQFKVQFLDKLGFVVDVEVGFCCFWL